MKIEQRIYDWLHERRIKRLTEETVNLINSNYRQSARTIDSERMAAIHARSREQKERMTALLHAKLGIK
jgi:hypothetical protein